MGSWPLLSTPKLSINSMADSDIGELIASIFVDAIVSMI